MPVKPALMPQPADVIWSEDWYHPGPELVVEVTGGNQHRLQNALARWQRVLGLQSGKSLSLVSAAEIQQPGLQLLVENEGAIYPELESDESYALSVSRDGIVISAPTTYGALHGLQTLRQLAASCAGNLCFPTVAIADKPALAWRGLMVDVVRHWIPVDAIKRQLDAMEAVKLNVLHWHLSDDQSFRVESKVYPLLHQRGSDGNYYSQSEILDIIDYAADRGIRVMPEFDLPGHSRSWQIAYPILASRPGQDYKLFEVATSFSDPLDPSREEVYQFIERLTKEMAALFPDRYFHLGGDEVNPDAWETNDAIRAFMQDQGLENHAALQAHFVQRYARIIKAQGKIAVGWNEVLHPQLPEDVVLHAWDRSDFPALVERHPVLVSVNYYLDHVRSAEFHYRNNPLALSIDGAATPELAKNILGVEAASWSEIVDSWNIDLCIWPRAAAIAESLWSPAEFVATADIDQVYQRMEATSLRLHQMGLLHLRNQRSELNELAGPDGVEVLKTLADIVEPTPFYIAFSWRTVGYLLAPWLMDETPDQPIPLQPFTRVLAYESLTAWKFNRMVERYLAEPDNGTLKNALVRQMTIWSSNHKRLLPIIAESELLQDAGLETLSLAVKELADIGLASIESSRLGRPLDASSYPLYVERVEYLRPPPLLFSAEFGEYALDRLFSPWTLRQHKLPIQRGVERLLKSRDGEL
ncbi:MAG: beta-N-acetylhexosaminidase [Halioglobus sp.]